MRLARSVLRRHAVAGDVHELVAQRFVAEGLARVLNIGCGEGELSRYLPDGASGRSRQLADEARPGPGRGPFEARLLRFRSRTSRSTVSRPLRPL